MKHSTQIKDPAVFVAIQYLDPEDTQDPVYLAARGISPQGVHKPERWWTPQHLADVLVAVAFILMLIWSRL